jgi:hypothetical protein
MKLFNNMTDEDFYFLHEEGELKSFCDALSFSLTTVLFNIISTIF